MVFVLAMEPSETVLRKFRRPALAPKAAAALLLTGALAVLTAFALHGLWTKSPFQWIDPSQAARPKRLSLFQRIKEKVFRLTPALWGPKFVLGPRFSAEETLKYMPVGHPAPAWLGPAVSTNAAGGRAWLLTEASMENYGKLLLPALEEADFAGGTGAPFRFAPEHGINTKNSASGPAAQLFLDYQWIAASAGGTAMDMGLRVKDYTTTPPLDLAFGCHAIIPNRGALLLIEPHPDKSSNCWFLLRVSTEADGRPVK